MKHGREGTALNDVLALVLVIPAFALLVASASSRAGDDAGRAKCMDNLRELSRAHSMYHADFDDWFTPHNYAMDPFDVPHTTWNWPVGFLEAGYIPGSGVMLCPAGVQMDLRQIPLVRDAGHPAWGLYVHYGYNYGYIGRAVQLGSRYHGNDDFKRWSPRRLFEIRNPAEKILNGDTDAHYGFDYHEYRHTPRHAGGINMLWADGSVSWMEDPVSILDGSSEARGKYFNPLLD